MRNPMLKQKRGTYGRWDERKTGARLLSPDTDVTNNEELYQAVRQHGSAEVLYAGDWLELTPDAFEAQWEGD